MVCNRCGKDKIRVWAGRYTGKNKVYTEGANGKHWNGRACPRCSRLKPVKYKEPELLGPRLVARPNLKKCRKCSAWLDSTYFHCSACIPKLPSVCHYAQEMAC